MEATHQRQLWHKQFLPPHFSNINFILSVSTSLISSSSSFSVSMLKAQLFICLLSWITVLWLGSLTTSDFLLSTTFTSRDTTLTPKVIDMDNFKYSWYSGWVTAHGPIPLSWPFMAQPCSNVSTCDALHITPHHNSEDGFLLIWKDNNNDTIQSVAFTTIRNGVPVFSSRRPLGNGNFVFSLLNPFMVDWCVQLSGLKWVWFVCRSSAGCSYIEWWFVRHILLVDQQWWVSWMVLSRQ